MKNPSATDAPSFKAVDGSEMAELVAQHMDKVVREVMSKKDNLFRVGMTYPVATVSAVVRIGLYHDPRNPLPYTVKDVPIKFATFVRPDENISGLSLIVAEEKTFRFDVGRSIESAPDALRESHSLEVTQPQKINNVVVDAPVESESKVELTCVCGKSFKSKPALNTHATVHCQIAKDAALQGSWYPPASNSARFAA